MDALVDGMVNKRRSEYLKKLDEAVLYGIVDLGYVEAQSIEAAAKALIAGGAGVLQLRAKGCAQGDVLAYAKRLRAVIEGVPFIVNDFPEIARGVHADGVHIGQDDGSLEEVRKVVGAEMLVGRSTHSPVQALGAVKEGFDYIGFGPLFPTPTKLGRLGIGLEDVRAVVEEVEQSIPVFCIGGVKRANLCTVREAGARRVVVVSDVLLAESIELAAREVCAGMA